jgi:hypothetical protein
VTRYTIITVILVLASFVVQQFLPAFTALHHSRILLVQLVFLCAAVTVGQPAMLLIAYIAGILWDTQSTLGPLGGDPEIYTQPVESLRFGYSILLFGGMGLLMQGIQPLFKQGKWYLSSMLSGIAIFLYLAAEYLLITFVRGNFFLAKATVLQMTYTAILTLLLSPRVVWLLFSIASFCGPSIHPEAGKKKRRRQH